MGAFEVGLKVFLHCHDMAISLWKSGSRMHHLKEKAPKDVPLLGGMTLLEWV